MNMNEKKKKIEEEEVHNTSHSFTGLDSISFTVVCCRTRKEIEKKDRTQRHL